MRSGSGTVLNQKNVRGQSEQDQTLAARTNAYFAIACLNGGPADKMVQDSGAGKGQIPGLDTFGGSALMALLIICEPIDIHACAVAWAVRRYGCEAFLWCPSPPFVQCGSMQFNSTSVSYRFPATGGEIVPRSIDRVWMRRWPRTVFPQNFGKSEKIVSRNELRPYHLGLIEMLPNAMLWANPLANGRSADFKPKQLAAAIAVGLSIPTTLITDDAGQARDFVASYADGQIIYKPFYSLFWERPGNQIYQTVTTPVSRSELEDPRALIWSPGIFQEFVPRRPMNFGSACSAGPAWRPKSTIRIRSTGGPASMI